MLIYNIHSQLYFLIYFFNFKLKLPDTNNQIESNGVKCYSLFYIEMQNRKIIENYCLFKKK